MIEKLIKDLGGKVEEVGGPLPDGSGYAIASFPLRKDHWIYGDENNVSPMPLRMGTNAKVTISFNEENKITLTTQEFEQMLKTAGRYAVKCATMNGKEMDFDPDALIQNLMVGMFGYGTENALSQNEWANPPNQDPNKIFQINEKGVKATV